MHRFNKDVIYPLLLFFVTFVMICNAASSYKSNWHYDKDSVIDRDSISNELEIDSSIFISRLRKSSPRALRLSGRQYNEFDELNQFPHATYQEHTSKFNTHSHSTTSCGQITCDSVPGYPEDIIIEVAKSSNLIPESPKARGASRENFPVPRSLDHNYISHQHHTHSPERVHDCSKLVKVIVTHPREALNENGQPKLVVNLPEYNFGPLAKECRGPSICRDATTPEHKVYKCENDYIFKVVEIFIPETQKIEKQNMKIANGCKCGLYDE